MRTIKIRWSGQSLFEVVVAVGISALIIVAIVSLVTNSLRGTVYSKNATTASALAQEATEWLRGQRDVDISTFLANVNVGAPTVYCFKSLDWSEHNDCLATDLIDSTFTRWGTFTPLATSDNKTVIEAKITVRWTDSQDNHDIVNVTTFTDWRQR